MNERDKELANQAWQQNPGWHDGFVNIQILINLVRADEREAVEERVVDLFTDMQTPYLPDIVRVIEAKENTNG